MLRATKVVDHFHEAVDSITLNETDRHRRRIKFISDGGIAFLLDLPEARQLRHGEGLLLDDGRTIVIRAEPEELLEVKGKDARHLLALVWQIGNRHLAAEIKSDQVLIRKDEVIRTMLEQLGATVNDVIAPFNPEGGAYDNNFISHHHHE